MYLEKTYGKAEVQARGIAIGYDHRRLNTLNSEQFALYSAAVALSRDIKVYLYKGYVATPLVVRYTAYDTKVYIYPIMMTKI